MHAEHVKPVVTTRTNNPYAALAACLRTALRLGWSERDIREFRLKATGGTLGEIIPACRERFTLV